MSTYVPRPKTLEVVLNGKSDLHKLNRTLSDNQEALINIVLGVANDTSQDVKLRLDAAKFLLDKRVSVSESIQKETITKLLIADKLSGASKQQSIANEYQQPRAVLSLDIQRQEGVTYDELNKEDNSYDLRDVGSFEP